MFTHFSASNLQSLEQTATTAAAYLDACDAGHGQVRVDAEYYRCCGELLVKIFSFIDPRRHFKALLEHSPAAREVVESLEISHHLQVSRLIYYPHLAVLLQRVAA